MKKKLSDLREVLEGGEFLVLDTETTGLDEGEIVQISIIDQGGLELINTLVKPVKDIPLAAYRIHGIDAEKVKDSPTFSMIANKVLQIIQEKNVIIYNAEYDVRMLYQSTQYSNLPTIPWLQSANWVCAMHAYAEFIGDWSDYRGGYKWHKLSTAAYQQGVIAPNAHSAYDDCITTLAVCRSMVKK